MEFKKITELKSTDLKTLRAMNSDGMRPGEWRLMPLHGDDHDFATEWQVFELEEGEPGGNGCDIVPVSETVPYWSGLELVRAHNFALGFYLGE